MECALCNELPHVLRYKAQQRPSLMSGLCNPSRLITCLASAQPSHAPLQQSMHVSPKVRLQMHATHGAQCSDNAHIILLATNAELAKCWNKVLTYINHLSATRGPRLTKHANAQRTLHVDHPVPRQTTRKRRRQSHGARHQDGAAVPTLQIISTPHAGSCTATHTKHGNIPHYRNTLSKYHRLHARR